MPKSYRFLVLAVLVLAFALRFHALERQDIWGDEAFSIWLSGQPLSKVVAGGSDTHPPGYPLLLALWMRLAGASPTAVRGLSALISTLTVAVVWSLGRRALGRAPALIATVLAALSPALVYYAQETRMYSLLALLASASWYWALRVTGRRAPPAEWAAYLLASSAAAYVHYYALFVILAENVVALLAWGKREEWPKLARWMGAQLLLALAYVPWIFVQAGFLGGKASARVTEWDLATALTMARETLVAFSAGLAVPPERGYAIALPFAVAAAVGLVALWRAPTRARSLAAYLLVPFACAWAVNPVMPFFFPRYLLLIAPAFYLLAAAGLVLLGRFARPALALGLAALVVGSGVGLQGYFQDEAYVKGRYGQMMGYVEEHAQPGDALLLANHLQIRIFEYYRPEGVTAYFVHEHELEEVAERHPRIWLVRFGNRAEYDPHDELNRWLSTEGSKAHASGWVDADLALYVMDSAAGEAPRHALDVTLGESVRLEGYSLSADRLAPGDVLILTLYWRATEPLGERYTVFTHLLGPEGVLRAQMDSEPGGGSRPTDGWPVDELIADNYAIALPEDVPAGEYTLQAGMYRLHTGERLVARGAGGEAQGDAVVLQGVTVTAGLTRRPD